MRITFVLPPVNLTGGIRVAAIHAKALAQKGHSVTLVSPQHAVPSARAKMKSLLTGGGWPRRCRIRPSHLDGSGLEHRVVARDVIEDCDVPDGDVVIAT